jgi:hypothetical protein
VKRKVKELAMKLYEETHKHFPVIRFVSIQEHPEQANRYWINVGGDMDEQSEAEMRTFVGQKAMNILVQEGYSFAVMLDNTLLQSIH